MSTFLVKVECLQCGRMTAHTTGTVENLPLYEDKPIVFCSMECNRAFVRQHGLAQQEQLLREQEELDA